MPPSPEHPVRSISGTQSRQHHDRKRFISLFVSYPRISSSKILTQSSTLNFGSQANFRVSVETGEGGLTTLELRYPTGFPNGGLSQKWR